MDLTFNTTDIIKDGIHRNTFQDMIVLYGQQKVEHHKKISMLKNIPQGALNINEALDLANNDVLIEHWPIAIKAPIEIMDVSVPNELPNNTYIDEKNNEIKKQFKEWGDQPLQTSNDETMVLLRGNLGGQTLTSDVWKRFANNDSSLRIKINNHIGIDNYTIEVLGPIEIGQLKKDSNWSNNDL